MQIKTSRGDIIWSYLAYLLGFGTNIIIVLFVMNYISSESLGMWYTFLSVGSLAQILDFGISSTLIRNVTYAWSGAERITKEGLSELEINNEPNYLLLKRIIYASRQICFVIGLTAFVILLFLGTIYIKTVSGNLSTGEYLPAWGIYILAVFLNIYYLFWGDSLRGIGAVKESQQVIIIARLVQIVVSIGGVIIGYGLLGLSFAYFMYGFVYRVISKHHMYNYHHLKKSLDDTKYIPTLNDTKEIFGLIWYNAKKTGLVSLATFMTYQTTTLVCSLYIGLSETASYGLCSQIFTSLASVSQIWFQAETPTLISLRINDKIEEVKRKLSLSVAMYWIIYLLLTVAFLIVGIPVLSVMKSDTALPYIMVVLVAVTMALDYNHSIFCGYIAMTNKIIYMKAGMISGVLITILSILCGYFTHSIYALIIVRMIVELVYNNWKWPYYVLKELNMSIKQMANTGFNEVVNIIRLRHR